MSSADGSRRVCTCHQLCVLILSEQNSSKDTQDVIEGVQKSSLSQSDVEPENSVGTV